MGSEALPIPSAFILVTLNSILAATLVGATVVQPFQGARARGGYRSGGVGGYKGGNRISVPGR